MANEVILQAYRYRRIIDISETDETERPIFCDNDLHDLESLWWTCIYELLMNRDASEMRMSFEEVHKIASGRREAALAVFSKTGAIDARINFLDDKIAFDKYVAWMPEKYELIKSFLGYLRKGLVRFYVNFEAKLPVIQLEALEDVQDLFFKAFDKCLEISEGIEISPCKTTAIQPGSIEQEKVQYISAIDTAKRETRSYPVPSVTATGRTRAKRKLHDKEEEQAKSGE